MLCCMRGAGALRSIKGLNISGFYLAADVHFREDLSDGVTCDFVFGKLEGGGCNSQVESSAG